MISSKKDAAIVRATIQKLRALPRLYLESANSEASIRLETEASKAARHWCEVNIIPELLKLLPEEEKANRDRM